MMEFITVDHFEAMEGATPAKNPYGLGWSIPVTAVLADGTEVPHRLSARLKRDVLAEAAKLPFAPAWFTQVEVDDGTPTGVFIVHILQTRAEAEAEMADA